MKHFYFALLATSISLFASQGKAAAAPADCCDGRNLKTAIPVYETVDVCGKGGGFRGDVLCMVYTAPILTYASEQTLTNAVLHSHILNVPAEVSVGCNLAVMYTLQDQPGYTLEASWYYVPAEFSRNVAASNIVPAHSVALTNAAPGTANVEAKITINFFDLLLKKDFALGNWFFMTPAAGLIGGYMDGTNTAQFQATSGGFSTATGGNTVSTTATLAYATKFEGIGIKLGGSASFKLWRGLKLNTELFYSVLYGFAKAELNYSQNGLSLSGTTNGSVVHFSEHQSRPFFDSLLGFAWEQRFKNDSYFLDVHAGWRFQTFADGWEEFEAELNDSLHSLALQGQGLQAGATFKF